MARLIPPGGRQSCRRLARETPSQQSADHCLRWPIQPPRGIPTAREQRSPTRARNRPRRAESRPALIPALQRGIRSWMTRLGLPQASARPPQCGGVVLLSPLSAALGLGGGLPPSQETPLMQIPPRHTPAWHAGGRASSSPDQQARYPKRSGHLIDRVTSACGWNLDVFGAFPWPRIAPRGRMQPDMIP